MGFFLVRGMEYWVSWSYGLFMACKFLPTNIVKSPHYGVSEVMGYSRYVLRGVWLYYIFVTSVCQSKWPFWWSMVHQIDHSADCDMMSGPPSFLLSNLQHWKVWHAAFQQYTLYVCNLSILVKVACPVISGRSNGPPGWLWGNEWSTKLPFKYSMPPESCGPLIILQIAGQSIWCIRYHQMGWFDWYTDMTNI